MVNVYQVVLGAIAVSTMILVPVGVVFLHGLLAGRWDAAISNWRGSRRQKAERRRNLRAMPRQQGVPLEQVAANLRRLRGVLTVDAHHSAGAPDRQPRGVRPGADPGGEMLQIEHDLVSVPLEWCGTSSGFGSRPSSNGLASCYQTGDTVRRPDRFLAHHATLVGDLSRRPQPESIDLIGR